MQHVLIDLDNITNKLYSYIYRTAKKYNKNFPGYKYWTNFNCLEDFFETHMVHKIFSEAIEKSDSEIGNINLQMDEFTNYLKSKNLQIKIITDRNSIYRDSAIKWLKNNNITFDEFIISNQRKSEFVNEDTLFVIDDNPKVLNDYLKVKQQKDLKFSIFTLSCYPWIKTANLSDFEIIKVPNTAVLFRYIKDFFGDGNEDENQRLQKRGKSKGKKSSKEV